MKKYKRCLLLAVALILCVYPVDGNTDCIHATIIRQVENDGFHREIYSLVEIIASHPSLSEECSLLLVESLPSGIFVNPDQLADLRRMGQVQACASESVDVELSQSDSYPVTVHVHSELNETENLLSALLNLPVHLRYHSPSPLGGYTRTVLNAPSLLVRCKDDVPCIHEKVMAPCEPCGADMCEWLNVSYKTNSPSILMQIPVGNISHYPLVALVTLLVTCGGCFYILSSLAGSLPDENDKED